MQILQKCNPKNGLRAFLLTCLVLALSGCASKNQPAINISPSQHESQSSSENLSTTTVAPVGFQKFMGIFTPYRITIQQGNFVSKEMADQIKEGMTREQVRFILGTALLTDVFHTDRWDYIFRLLKPSGELITSRITVYFQQGLVSKIERGDLPSEQEYLARIAGVNE